MATLVVVESPVRCRTMQRGGGDELGRTLPGGERAGGRVFAEPRIES